MRSCAFPVSFFSLKSNNLMFWLASSSQTCKSLLPSIVLKTHVALLEVLRTNTDTLMNCTEQEPGRFLESGCSDFSFVCVCVCVTVHRSCKMLMVIMPPVPHTDTARIAWSLLRSIAVVENVLPCIHDPSAQPSPRPLFLFFWFFFLFFFLFYSCAKIVMESFCQSCSS